MWGKMEVVKFACFQTDLFHLKSNCISYLIDLSMHLAVPVNSIYPYWRQDCYLQQREWIWNRSGVAFKHLMSWELPADWLNRVLHHLVDQSESWKGKLLSMNFVMQHFQSLIIIGLADTDFMMLTNITNCVRRMIVLKGFTACVGYDGDVFCREFVYELTTLPHKVKCSMCILDHR